MPRIRTLKPEFFRSPSTAQASERARILYMAMWCWADDWGIGETNVYGLLGFAFPDEDEIPAAEIPRLLKEIQCAYEVAFYKHRGRYFYAVMAWDEHQKTERRAAKRRPGPDDPESTRDLRFYIAAEIPRQNLGNTESSHGKYSLGTGEQGNRGTGEQGVARAREPMNLSTRINGKPPEPATPPPTDYGPNYADAVAIIGAVPRIRDHPAKIRAELIRNATALLNGGLSTDVLTRTMARWMKKQLPPSQLASLASDVLKEDQGVLRNGHQTGTEKSFDRIDAVLAKYQPNQRKGIE